MCVEEYAYYVNKLRENVGLGTWIWRQIVTSQKRAPNTNDHHMPLNETTDKGNFLRTPLVSSLRFSAFLMESRSRNFNHYQVSEVTVSTTSLVFGLSHLAFDSWCSDMGRLHHKCNRLRLLITCVRLRINKITM